jgi:hypothetical protein
MESAILNITRGEAQESRWLAGIATDQLKGAQDAMLAGDLDDAAAAIRRAVTALGMIANSQTAILKRTDR